MDNESSEQQKNNQLSIVVIIVNIILAAILCNNISSSNDPDNILIIPVVIWMATILAGIYTFTYSGKVNKLARWIFGILLVISVGLIGLTLYIIALAGAYKN